MVAEINESRARRSESAIMLADTHRHISADPDMSREQAALEVDTYLKASGFRVGEPGVKTDYVVMRVGRPLIEDNMGWPHFVEHLMSDMAILHVLSSNPELSVELEDEWFLSRDDSQGMEGTLKSIECRNDFLLELVKPHSNQAALAAKMTRVAFASAAAYATDLTAYVGLFLSSENYRQEYVLTQISSWSARLLHPAYMYVENEIEEVKDVPFQGVEKMPNLHVTVAPSVHRALAELRDVAERRRFKPVLKWDAENRAIEVSIPPLKGDSLVEFNSPGLRQVAPDRFVISTQPLPLRQAMLGTVSPLLR